MLQAGSVAAAHTAATTLLASDAGETFSVLQQEPGIVMLEAGEDTASTPNDPSYNNQRHYTGSPVDMPRAWAVETGSRDVVVAITDSGMDMSHPDIESNK